MTTFSSVKYFFNPFFMMQKIPGKRYSIPRCIIIVYMLHKEKEEENILRTEYSILQSYQNYVHWILPQIHIRNSRLKNSKI